MANEWNLSYPIDHTLISDVPGEIRKLKDSVKDQLKHEHETPVDGDATGSEHSSGSAVAYEGSSTPSTRPGGATLGDNAIDRGRIWINDGGKLKRWSGTAFVGAGGIVQIVNTQTGAVNTGTTTMPRDDTIPQKTEGDEYMTLAITPVSSSNKLKIDVVFAVANTSGNLIPIVALFQDTTANALACIVGSGSADGNVLRMVSFTHYMTAGTTSSTTFKVRAGAASGTITFNGEAGARRMGGVMASSITITEIAV